MLRRRFKLEEYDFATNFRAGKTIAHADFLTRIHKADSTGGEKKGEKSVIGHQQSDRASGEGETPEVNQQVEKASMKTTSVLLRRMS
jgi:hypothetical protein